MPLDLSGRNFGFLFFSLQQGWGLSLLLVFTKVEITQCFLVSQLPVSSGHFSALKTEVWTKGRVREWFSLEPLLLLG